MATATDKSEALLEPWLVKGNPKSAARVRAGEPPIPPERLRRISFPTKGMKSLEPLRRLQALEWLDLTDGTVPDLDPVAALPHLRVLRFGDKAKPKSLAPLAAAPSLKRLTIGAPYALLSELRRPLERLYLHTPAVTTLDPLRGLEGLRHLQLGYVNKTGGYVAVEEKSTFPPLPDLESLTIVPRLLRGLGPIRALTSLRSLAIPGTTELRNLDGIGALSHLERLSVHHTGVRDLSPVRGLPLRAVAVDECRHITDLAPLWDAPDLELVIATDTPIRSLEGAAKARKLRVLLTGDTSYRPEIFFDSADLAGLPALECLGLRRSRLPDYGFLATLPALRFLDLAGTSFDDPELLLSLPALQWVSLHETPLAARDEAIRARLDAALAARHGGVLWDRAGVGTIEAIRPYLYHKRVFLDPMPLVPGDWAGDNFDLVLTRAGHQTDEIVDDIVPLWQVRDGDRDAVIFIGRLHDGRFALYAPAGDSWTWFDGDARTVLATVPDRWFAEAAAAMAPWL